MARHPRIDVPDVGPMDHAWDLLGHWEVEMDLTEDGEALAGRLEVGSWDHAELALPPAEDTDIPDRMPLERVSAVHLTDAGGGALQWVYRAEPLGWTLQATLWPGALHLFVFGEDDPSEEIARGRARRTREYYLRKYPADG